MPFNHSNTRSITRQLMNSALRVYELFSRHNYSLEVTTTKDEIVGFFAQLHPQETQYPLIRLGSGDGGYLVPDDLEGVKLCLSPGYGGISTFESALSVRNIQSVIVDPEITKLSDNFQALDYSLSSYSSLSEKKISLEDLVLKYGGDDKELMLQMDIEGDEWQILQSTPEEALKRFRIVVVEFHSLSLIRNRWILKEIFGPALNRMSEVFEPVHLHVNNSSGSWTCNGRLQYPETVEVTYLRKDRVGARTHPAKLPHPLDEQTDSDRPEFDIATFYSIISIEHNQSIRT